METFKIMMINYKEIFNVEDDEDDNLDINNAEIPINASHKPLIIEEEDEEAMDMLASAAAASKMPLFNNNNQK